VLKCRFIAKPDWILFAITISCVVLSACANVKVANSADSSTVLETIAGCNLTDSDKAQNLTLTFRDFDQVGTLPSTARKLSERECYAQAALAGQDYLAKKEGLGAREINILTWHLAQNLASSGAEQEAALLMLAARRPPADPPEEDGFDWNTYALGSWAFLVKDKAVLDAAVDRLSAQSGARNQMNARALKGLQNCYGRTYRKAYGTPNCLPK
jgi:hypothetical protein